MINTGYFSTLFLSAFFLGGCYTQLLPNDPEPNPSVGDSIGRSEIRDTVRVVEHDRCFWTEDFFGHRVLKCIKSYYPLDWTIYESVPWWHRRDGISYDYGRCPRYYRYETSCGSCVRDWDFGTHRDWRFYDRYNPSPSIGGSQPAASEDASPSRPRSYGIPLPQANPPTKQTTEPKKVRPLHFSAANRTIICGDCG